MHAVALGEGDADFDGMNGTGATSEDGGLRVVIENDFAANAGSSSSDVQGRYPKNRPGADGEKWYTIQRVNGGGTGADGKVDDEEEGEEGMGKSLDHKHSLEESDRIKKNSVQRWILKEEKERRAGRKVCLSCAPIVFGLKRRLWPHFNIMSTSTFANDSTTLDFISTLQTPGPG